jgi:gamma-glutamyl hercynylcysteine S-oxide synthase
MSLYLSKCDINEIVEQKKFMIDKNILLKHIDFTKSNFLIFTNTKCTIHKDKNKTDNINPLVWQYGHVIFFYINHVIRYLDDNNKFTNYYKLIDFYDSFLTPLDNRTNTNKLMTIDSCMCLYNDVIDYIKDYIDNNEVGYLESYVIMLGILHNEMHNEAFIFTNLNIDIKTNIKPIQFDNSCLVENPHFIEYDKGQFIQGSSQLTNKNLIFDNEMPQFLKNVNKFEISKYPITEYMFLQFVLINGYNKEQYWCDTSKQWLKKNNIKLPKYWVKCGDDYFKIINNQKYNVKTNLPMSNISYYEAKAYCKWKNVRLPFEHEYEYVSTNMGKTLYPWGNHDPSAQLSNINYINNIVDVNKYQCGDNYNGVSQLIGNIWEWCEEPIYPYNGFMIDPIYREMSYPFFGYKKICKGGCFAVPDFLIHPKYRNAQYPDCRIQFIGFRVCKN